MNELTYYRFVNLFLHGPYAVYLGNRHNNTLLLLSGISVILVDSFLIGYSIFDLQIIQPIRCLSMLLVGPLWSYYGMIYRDYLLLILGLSLIVTDGALFIRKNKSLF